jgi:hypothetical protein
METAYTPSRGTENIVSVQTLFTQHFTNYAITFTLANLNTLANIDNKCQCCSKGSGAHRVFPARTHWNCAPI